MNIKAIYKIINQFREERDWRQFHNPKNLAISLALEAAEVLEHFQWKDMDEAKRYIKSKKAKAELAEELADVGVCLLYLCDELGIDLFEEIVKKVDKNAKKYPVDEAKGNSKKYTVLAKERGT